MAYGYLRLLTLPLQMAASTSATRISTTELVNGKPIMAVSVSAKIDNAGTLFIGSGATLREGQALTAGNAYDLGPVPTGSGAWPQVDLSTVYLTSSAGTDDYAIFNYYVIQ